MGVFNYSRFHYFDKDGHELILSHKPGVRINIINDNIPEFYAEYALVKSTPDVVDPATNSSLHQIKAGMRFDVEEGTTFRVKTSILDSSTDDTYIGDAFLRKGTYELKYYTSTFGRENYPYPLYNESNDDLRRLTLDRNNLAIDSSVNFFPSYTFEARMEFEKVSTGLVETQTIYVLVDDEYAVDKNGIGHFVPVSEYAAHYDEFVAACEVYDSSIDDLNDQIANIDSSISEVEGILSDELAEISRLTEEQNTLKEEARYVTRELNKHFESYGVVDPQLCARKRELDEQIAALDASIEAVYDSDPYHFGLLDDYNNLKEAKEKEIDDLLKEAEDLYNKRDYFKGVKDYIDRFDLLFFIDCREQKDFRIFDVRYDEMKWTDRKFLNFKQEREDGCNNNGFSVNVGFSGENDGVYEQGLYICLVDKANTENSELGEAYPIGEIKMAAETEGEDERYRSFFENFGIPDPKYYNNIFIDSDINNDSPDYISINKNSKKMFLAYNDIFPYIGSYKALLNAIRTLGYEDEIFFKEWYKEIGNSALEDSGYTTYEISFKDNTNRNLISNLDISERIHLRKMNWVSMVYKINEELDKPEDKFGFPTAITNYKNFNTDRLAKILSLKNWLEKYAMGVNCHITDVGGEGLVFERYNLNKYGTYQKVYEYDNEKAISAVIKDDAVALVNGTASINVDIHTTDKDVMIEELGDIKFLDLCDGYFDSSSIYHDFDRNVIDSLDYRYFGKCFDLHDNINTFEIRTRGKHNSFRFNRSLDNESPNLLIDNDKIFFDYAQCFNKFKNSVFKNPPVIQIENGIIKRYKPSKENSGQYDYYSNIYPYIENDVTYYRIEVLKNTYGSAETYDILHVPTFIPPIKSFNYGTFIDIQTYESNPEWRSVIIDHDGRILYGVRTDYTEYAPDLSGYIVSDGYGNYVRVDILIDDIKRNTYSSDPGENVNDYVQLDPLSYVSKISDKTRIERYRNHKYSTDSRYFERNGNTYGLRYCTDNANGIPCFKILGYEEKSMLLSSDHIRYPFTKEQSGSEDNEGYEYMLEIINGRMIFNDVDNNSIVTLNFVYDDKEKHQSIFVNTFKESDMSSLYRYKTAAYNTTDRFLPGGQYQYFIDGYNDDVDSYVTYDGSKSVIVNNVGEYTVDAILYDEFNNIFAKRSSKTINILPSFADASIFSGNISSGEPYNKRGTTAGVSTLSGLLSIFNNSTNGVSECIFEYVPKLQISNINKSTLELTYYGNQTLFDGKDDIGTNLVRNEETYSKAIFSSMADRYDVVADVSDEYEHSSLSDIFMLVKTSGYNAHLGVYDWSSVYYMLMKYGQTWLSGIGPDLDLLFNKNATDPNGSFADVTLYVYDELCEYPVASIPGVMLPGVAYGKATDYDTYFFMPVNGSKTTAATLSSTLKEYCSNSRGKTDFKRFTYYIIPQWSIPCTINKISQLSNNIDIDLLHQIFSIESYKRTDIGPGKMMSIFYNTRYNNNYYGKGSYMIKRVKNNNYTGYILYAYLGNKKQTIENDQSGFDGSTWFGPASLDYMTYMCDLNKDYSDNQIDYAVLVNNSDYRYCEYFVDRDYSISLRNFDPNDAIEIWEYDSDKYKTTGNIIAKYIHNVPITTTSPYIELVPHIPGYINTMQKIRSENVTVRWRIYKRVGEVSKNLIMESFNKALFIKLKEKGIYDIEMTVWDQHGNRFDKKMDGYITYK